MLLVHNRQNSAAACIRPDQVHLDGPYPRRHVVLLQGAHRPRNPRAVDQNVNGGKPLNSMAHHVLHLGWVGDVHWHDAGGGSQGLRLLRRLLQVAAGAGGQGQLGPLFGVCQGNGASNPPPSSRDQCYAIVQLAHVASLLCARVISHPIAPLLPLSMRSGEWCCNPAPRSSP